MVEEGIRRQVTSSPDADPMRVLVWIKEHKDMNAGKNAGRLHSNHWGEVKHPHLRS